MKWALKRQVFVIGIVVLIIAVFVGILGFVFVSNPSTCFDGEQNGTETGVDCGGGCELVCSFEASAPVVLFTQYVDSSERGDVVAHIRNINKGIDIRSAAYTIEVFTSQGDLLAIKKGSIDIPSQSTQSVFVKNITPSISMGARAFLTITDQYFYRAKSIPAATIESFSWSNLNTSPTLRAVVKGDLEEDQRRLPVTATVFNDTNKVLAVSETNIPVLEHNSQEEIIFTWQKSFSENPARVVFTFKAQ
ncbi:MAG: hypothetical protein ACJKSS_01220 [Patescibacteria group bacterium UBA2103]